MGKGKIWKGRFSKETAREMEKFSHSIDFDRILYEEDIAVNRAWAKSLKKIGILNKEELKKILTGLEKIKEEFKEGSFKISEEDEDIHSAIERRLTELIGETGKKIHTGRSRNDQVITDLFLYLKKKGGDIIKKILKLQIVIIEKAKEELDLIIPGYTHLQQAQPILFSHYLLSLFWVIERDKNLLLLCLKNCDIMPLGSGALGGSGFKIERKSLAQDLGFKEISWNSLDITSHRDIPISFAFGLTMIALHLGRYASDFINWATSEFGFVEIDEEYATGSSIMPQKRNPDGLELIRGKSASAIGHLTALFSLCHGLPHGYNRDLQEDKKHLFQIIEIVDGSLDIFTGILKTLILNSDRIKKALLPDLLATEIADYLTIKGVPFREAHEITGEILKWSNKNNLSIKEIPLDKLKEFSPFFEKDIYKWLDFERAIQRRSIKGGTAKSSVKEQIKQAEKIIRSSHINL
ncbi:MAG: argininosuccinate lyase [candidate division WOR-3 bacterium]